MKTYLVEMDENLFKLLKDSRQLKLVEESNSEILKEDNVHSESDLFYQAAAALKKRDGYALERLIVVTDGWMEDSNTKNARKYMLNVMAEAAYLLEDEPSDVTDWDNWEDD